jgi:hypothetical protein
MKKGIIYETLGSTDNLQITESRDNGEIRLHGVFGKCGVRNNNNRVYEKRNYGACVEEMQGRIAKQGVLGELEHPKNGFNIDLNNVSHKIESIEMNEDGTITGTILLLDTAKGKDAKAIVEGGCPLFISSRAAGSVDGRGNVTLQSIATYDLVGTPGFSEARLDLKESQTFECLNESIENGMWMIVESEEPDEEDKLVAKPTTEESTAEDIKKEETTDNNTKTPEAKEENSTNNDIKMEDIKKSIDTLAQKIADLEATLHITQESLKEKSEELDKVNEKIENMEGVNYQGIQLWIEEHFAPEFGESIKEQMKDFTAKYICEQVAPNLEKWITEEYSNKLQKWITEEYTGEIDKWITEEFASNVQNWITEECLPEYKQAIMEEMNANVSEFIESQKENKFANIDKMLESLSNADTTEAVQMLNESVADKFAGVPAIENMPDQYKPMWATLTESRQNEVARSSRLYDFTKKGVMESFWANVFADKNVVTESLKTPEVDPIKNRLNAVASFMKKMR